MKKTFYVASLLLTIAFLSSCAKKVDENVINWHNNFDNAIQVANKENKLVMLDLYTDWCTWCAELDETTFVDEAVITKSKDFIAVKINPEEDLLGEELIERYGIVGYPAIVFLNQNGDMLTKVNGFVDAKQFLSSMERALLMPAIIAEIENGNDNNIEAMEYYINLGDIEKAITMFDEMVANGQILYIDGSSKSIDELEENFIVAKYFDMGMKYMYELGDIEAASKLYERLAKEYQNSDYIFSIDICILNLYMANNDTKAIVEYVKNTASKRNNLPQEYIEMYQSILADLDS